MVAPRTSVAPVSKVTFGKCIFLIWTQCINAIWVHTYQAPLNDEVPCPKSFIDGLILGTGGFLYLLLSGGNEPFLSHHSLLFLCGETFNKKK